MLSYINEFELAEEVLNYSESQKNAVRTQWTGKWFRRAWLAEDLGWIGNDRLWLEPQPWAIIGNVIENNEKIILAHHINELVRKPSKIGARLLSKGIQHIENVGQGVNGGIWPSINGTLIWALSQVDGQMGWDEWKKNTLAYHADHFPEVWYGIWSGPDTYNSDLSKHPGQTVFDEKFASGEKKLADDEESLAPVITAWTDFPVFNLHTHAWPLYSITRLIGIDFTSEGVELKPTIPKDSFKFKSSLIGLEKTKSGYSGWYKPKIEGRWKVTIELSSEDLVKINSILTNGNENEFMVLGNRIVMTGESKIEQPFKWEINFS
jgi:hypothetical protein